MVMYIKTKNDRARRNAISKGVQTISTNATLERWAAKKRADEAFARSLGVNITYEDIETHNASLWRIYPKE